MKKAIGFIMRFSYLSLCTVGSLLILLIGSLLWPQAGNAQGSRYKLMMYNDTNADIRRIYMSSSETEKWGLDHLGDNILLPGMHLTLSNIVPGEYDIRFIDEDKNECIVRKVNISKDISWSVTSEWLLRCMKSFSQTSRQERYTILPSVGNEQPSIHRRNTEEKWFVIFGNFAKHGVPQAKQRRASLINQGYHRTFLAYSDEYPNLKPGYLVVMIGPLTKLQAEETRSMTSAIVTDAYIKAGW